MNEETGICMTYERDSDGEEEVEEEEDS